MKRILVSVFDSEQAAFEGMSALKDLHRDGTVTLHALAVVGKDPDGVPSILETEGAGLVGTLAGGGVGAIAGLLGGPVGMAVGASLGATGGLVFDLAKADAGLDFVQKASAGLAPGQAAVVADVDEGWTVPIEARLGTLGGRTYGARPGELIEADLVREAEAAAKDVDTLLAEIDSASGQARATIGASIAGERQKLEVVAAEIDQMLDQEDAEIEAALATLRAQRDAGEQRKRAAFQARMDELKASSAARRAKLRHARRLAQRSMRLTREAVLP